MRKIVFVSLFALFMCITGCANFSTLPVTNDMESIKGMSKEAILHKYGEPDEKSPDNNVWDYKKPSDNGHNKVMSTGTLGLCGKKCLPYVDITRLKFTANKVASVKIIKEAFNITRSQVSILSGFLRDDKNKELLEQAPTEVKMTLKEQQGVREPEVAVASHSAPASNEKGFAVAKESRMFTGCTLKNVKSSLCANAKKLGMKVENDGNKIAFITSDGERITTNFKQIKKGIVVELTSKQEEAAYHMQKILRN